MKIHLLFTGFNAITRLGILVVIISLNSACSSEPPQAVRNCPEYLTCLHKGISEQLAATPADSPEQKKLMLFLEDLNIVDKLLLRSWSELQNGKISIKQMNDYFQKQQDWLNKHAQEKSITLPNCDQ